MTFEADVRTALRMEADRLPEGADPGVGSIMRRGRHRRVALRTAATAGIGALILAAGSAAMALRGAPAGTIEVAEISTTSATPTPPSTPVASPSPPAVRDREALPDCESYVAGRGLLNAEVVDGYLTTVVEIATWFAAPAGGQSAGAEIRADSPWAGAAPDAVVTVCLVHADVIPAPGSAGQEDPYQWELVATVPDGGFRPLTASLERPADLPHPHPGGEHEVRSKPRTADESLAAWLAVTQVDTLPILSRGIGTGVPRLVPPADPHAATISRSDAEQIAASRLGDLSSFQGQATVLADVMEYPAGAAAESSPAAARRLVWAVMVGPSQRTEAVVGGPSVTFEVVQIAMVDAVTGTLLLIWEQGFPTE